MMAGTGDDMGGFKGLKGGVELSSHQDLTQVGGDCGGTKIDFAECKGNGNVCDDVGGSYVLVGEVNGGDPVGGLDCNVEVKDGMGLKDGGVVEVGNGGVVVGIGGDDGEFAVEGNDRGLVAVMDKGVALHGELVVESGGVGVVDDGRAGCEVNVEDQVGLKDESGVGVENGNGVVGDGGNGCEVQVKDQVDLKDESGVGVENGEVVVGDGGNDQDYTVEENNCGLSAVTNKDVALHGELFVETGSIGVVEDGQPACQVKAEDQSDFEFTTKPMENQEAPTDTDRELGERQEEVIGLMLERELSENSVKSVEQIVLLPSADLGENKKSEAVVLEADVCELAKVEDENEVDVGVRQLKQTEIKLVEESLEPQISVTSSVNCVSLELGKDQAKLKRIIDLANDAELRESKETVIESSAEAGELSDICARAVQQDVIISPADFGQESDTVVLDADGCELPKVEAGTEVGVVDGKPEEQTELESVEDSLRSHIRITESVDCLSHELEEDGNKFKNNKDLDSDIKGGFQLNNEINAVANKGICMASADDYEVSRECIDGSQSVNELDTDSDIKGGFQLNNEINAVANKGICMDSSDDYEVSRECIDGSQSVNKLDSTPSNAGTLCSIEKVPIKCGESTIAGTADGATVELEPSGCVYEGNDSVNLANLESDRSQMSVELSGHVPAEICGSFVACIDAGTVSDEGPEDADFGVGLVQRCKAKGVVQVTNGDGTMTKESGTLQTNLEERIGGCAKSPELNGNPDDAQCNCMVMQAQSDGSFQSDSNGNAGPKVGNLACPVTERKSELETKNLDTEDVKSGLLSATTGTKSEMEGSDCLSSHHPNDGISGMKIEFGTFGSAELLSKSGSVDVLSESQISNGDIEKTRKADSTMNSAGSESYADMNFKSGVQYHSDMPAKDATVAESKVPSGSVNVGPAPLLECSGGDSVNGQNLGVVAKAKPFKFLVKLPRFDDDKLRQQIKDAQLLVDEKTLRRDAIRSEIEMKRAKLQSINYKYEATKSEERAARRSVKLKRQEIDSIQDGINRVKNSISVIDITNRITHMEHMIEHETNPLKEEKQLLREINTLRKLRDQISSNVCPADEVTLAFSQIEPMEMQLKTLKRDLSDLKAKVSNAEAAVILLGKEYSGESKKLKELQAQFRAANDVRQDAYKDFLSLKRQLHEKSKHFWMYKDEAKAANDYALSGDREALYRLCTNQVETFMDLWNKNDKFRGDYVRCNMRSTLRRLKTSDGRSLGPDEEAPVIPIYVGEREEVQLSTPSRTTYPSPATNMKQENTVKPVKSEQVDGKALAVAEPKNKILIDKTSVKPIPGSGSVLPIVSVHLEDVETKEEGKQQTEEELELARKAEMLREEEIAAKLKEKIRQERAKAQEALERKKRNAEKAQMRAMLRAQKEAEQKEKEREKRQRKKEKKNADGETGLELQTESTKEERTDSPGTQPKKSSQVNKYSKPKPAAIPPALRNRGKRHCKQFMWWLLAVLMVFFVFLVGNVSTYRKAKPVIRGDRFSGNHWQPI